MEVKDEVKSLCMKEVRIFMARFLDLNSIKVDRGKINEGTWGKTSKVLFQ